MSDLLKLINKNVRHDVLNDLTYIRSILELYGKTKDDNLLKTLFRKIDSSADFLKKMRELESMVSEGNLKPLKIGNALNPISDKYKEFVNLNIQGDCTVMADESLTSVFDNLIGNAITHGNADRVDIKIINKGEVCQVEIKDNGKGIPDKIKEKIFEEGVTTNGSGLGLYITKKTIERYGGDIRLKDNQQGTTFVLLLKTSTSTQKESRDSGIQILGNIDWGTHICHFYQTKEDLTDALLPYFKAGLDNNEYCVWVTSEYSEEEAQKLVDEQISNGVEVISYKEWYNTDDKRLVLNKWSQKLNQSLADGYDGLRVAGDAAWLDTLKEFISYEEEVHSIIDGIKMIAVCSYPFNRLKTSEIAELTSRHHYTLVIREGEWELIENFEYRKTQNVLQEVEEKYRALVENANESIMVVQDEKIMYANPKAMESSGFSKDEIMFKPFAEFIHPDDREIVFERYNNRMSGKKSSDRYQFRFKDKKGNTRWAELNAALIEWNGKPATLNFLTDITAQKEAEMEKNRLLKAIETTEEAIAIFSPEERIVYTNDAYDRLHGYQKGELMGELPSIINPNHLHSERKVTEIINYVKKNGVWEGELYNLRKDGSEFISYATITAIKDEDDNIVNYVVAKNDITKKKKLEERNRRTRDMLQNFIDTSPLAIVGLDEDLKISLWNPAAEQIFGWSKEEVIGRDNPVVPEEKQEKFQNWHRKIMEDRTVRQKEVFMLRKDGSTIPVQMSSSTFTNPDGSATAMAVIADISERKEAEKRLWELKKSYQELFDKSGDALFIIDPGTAEILDVNQRMCELYGYSREEALKLRAGDLSPGEPYNREKAGELIQKTRTDGPQTFEWQGRTKEGETFWEEVTLKKAVIGGEERILASVRDITDRKQSERELEEAWKRSRESEKLYSTLVENVNDMVYMLDSSGKVTFFNSYVKEHYSLNDEDAENLSGTHIAFFWCDESIDKVQETVNKVREQRTEQAIDCVCDDRYYQLKITPLIDSDELIGMIAIARDFTEHKKTEDALREKEKTLEGIVDGSPVPMFVLDENHKVVHWNKACEKISGVSAGEVVGTNKQWYPWYNEERPVMADLIVDEDEDSIIHYYSGKQLNTSIMEGAYEGIDYFPHLGENGKWLYFAACPLKDDEGRIIGAIETFRDITERKNAEKSLKESETRLKEAQRVACIGHWELDPELGTPMWSEEVFRIFGLDPRKGEPSFIDHEKYVHPDDWPLLDEAVQKAVEDGTPFDIIFRILRPNGEMGWMHAIGTASKDEEGNVIKLFGTAQDITKLKKAERSLRESEQKFRQFFESEPEYCYIISPDRKILDVNHAALNALGYKREELVGEPLEMIYAPESLPKMRELFDEWSETGEIRDEEMIVTTKNGEKRVVLLSSSSVKDDDGETLNSISVQRDITERKQKEEEVRRLSQFQESIIDNASIWLDVLDNNGNVVIWNKAAEEISGYSKEEVIGHNKIWEWLYPDEDYREQITEKAASIIRGEEVKEFETTVTTKDGQQRIISWYSNNLVDDEGEPIGSIALGSDVTERKIAENLLQESEKKYRLLVENLNEGIWVIDGEGYTTFVNPKMAEILGYAKEEMIGEHLFSFMDEQGVEIAQKNIEKRKEGVKEQHEFMFLKKDGNKVYTILETSPILDEDGNYLGAIAGVIDISELKEAEKKLRESEASYRATFEHTGTAMIVIEEDTTISIANKECEKLSGYSKEEIEGKMKWTEFVHPDDLERMLGYHFNRRRGEGTPNKYEFRLIDGNGNIRDVFITIDLIPGTTKSVASLMDVTQIKVLNRLLKAITEINEVVARVKKPEVVLGAVCKNLKLLYEDIFACIIREGEPVPVKSEGISPESINHVIDKCPSVHSALKGHSKKISTDSDSCQHCIEKIHSYALSIPLIHEKQHGIITIHSNSDFSGDEILLLNKLASNIAFALSAYEVDQEKTTAIDQLDKNLSQFDMAADRLRNPLAVIMSALELKDIYGKDKVLEVVHNQSERIKEELDKLRREEYATHQLIKRSKFEE